MRPLVAALVVALAAGGLFFTLVAALGLVRLPDVYSRAHATSKSDTLGAGLALAAAALVLDPWVARLKIALLVAFVLVTNPVAAHAISRSAYLRNVTPWEKTGRPTSGTAARSGADQRSEGSVPDRGVNPGPNGGENPPPTGDEGPGPNEGENT